MTYDPNNVFAKILRGELPCEKVYEDEQLYERYWEQIPVVLVDGEQHTFWRVDAARLRKALGG